MVPEFDWPQIDTVLLDMDGTLLDLEFDSHFWLSLVPQALSERRAIPFDEARHIIEREYQAVQHTMNWYCFDYWSERLDLDIYRMTSEVGSRARLREDTEPFLRALRDAGLQTILLTNAHPHSLAVKIEHTGLDRHLDLLFSTHTFGYPISVCGRRCNSTPDSIRSARCSSTTASRSSTRRALSAFVTAWACKTRTPVRRRKASSAIRRCVTTAC